MSVKKILLITSMSLAAIVFAVPAVAQANVELTENGVALSKGDKVTMTSTNWTSTTNSGTIQCNKVTLHYEVEVNGSNFVILYPVSNQSAGPDKHNGTTEGCVLSTPLGSLPEHMKTFGTDAVIINQWGTATMNITFTTEVTTPQGTLTCEYHGSMAAQWSHTVNSSLMTVETNGSVLTGTPSPPCSSSSQLHGELTVEASDGKPLFLDFAKTT